MHVVKKSCTLIKEMWCLQPRQDLTCPVVSPALPVNSVTSAPVPIKKVKTPKKNSKTKPKTMKLKTKVEANTMEVDEGNE